MSKIIQSNMCLNPDTGSFEVERIEATISLDKNNNYIRSDSESKKSLIDLGYTIENVETALFYINDTMLTKRFVDFAEELRDIEMAINEVCIITKEPSFKSVICLASANISSNNTLRFNIDSYSSTVRASVLEDMNTIKLDTIKDTENIKELAITEIISIKTEAIEETNNIKSASIIETTDTKREATSEINNTKTASIAAINEIKDSATSVVENIKTVSIAEITDTKTEAITETESIKNMAIEEITNVAQNFQDYVDSLGDILARVEGKVDEDIFLSMMFDYAGDINKLPLSYMICDGREVSRTGKYSKLFERIGTIWGAGNMKSTFNLPDGRGAVAKGAGSSTKYQYDENRGEVGSYQNTAIRNITGGVTRGGLNSDVIGFGVVQTQRGIHDWVGGEYGASGGLWDFDASRAVPTGQTNRDNNFAVLKVIYIGNIGG